jgi:hypothetical protein
VQPVTPGEHPEDPDQPAVLPAIVPNATPGFFLREYHYRFEGSNITIRVNVSASLYFGAQNGIKYALVAENATPESMAGDYYRSFEHDPAQDGLYADLRDQFHALLKEHRYSDDEYLELVSTFVQGLPYDTTAGFHPDTTARFPAETLVDGTGDCDDKTILLAGLLARDGYNVSLLLFIPEHHMATGVAAGSRQYGTTGYAYLETTGISLVGDVPRRLNQSQKYVADGERPVPVPLASTPVVIRIGSGSKEYSRAEETAYIIDRRDLINARLAVLNVTLAAAPRNDRERAGRILDEYNTYAVLHNMLVRERGDRAAQYRTLRTFEPSACPGFSGTRTAECGAGASYPSLPCILGMQVTPSCSWQNIRQDLMPGPG